MSLHFHEKLKKNNALHRQIFRVMNKLGLSQSQDTTRRNVDELTAGCDEELLTWKKDIEVSRHSILTDTTSVILNIKLYNWYLILLVRFSGDMFG